MVNPNGYSPELVNKTSQLKRAIQENEIDYILSSSLDRKWNPINQKIVQNQMRLVLQNLQLVTANAGAFQYEVIAWQPGEVLSLIGNKWSYYANKEKFYKDKLGRWYEIQSQANNKAVTITNIYRMPENKATHSLSFN